jgi:CBS domain containing-hemolysin-like protein
VTSTGWYLLAAVALLLANGLFVGAEFALVAARRNRIEQLSKTSDRATMALKSMRELSFMLAGAQLGITMCSLGLGFVAEPAAARLIESALHSVGPLPPTLLHSMSFVIAITIVTFLHMVIGEMAPKNIAIAEPEKSALWLALPFRAFVNLFRPFVRALNALANGGTRLLGATPVEERHDAHTAEEIGAIVQDLKREGLLEDFQQKLLSGALGIRERDAGDVMVPRVEIVALPVTSTPAALEQVVVATGHSRIPVYARDIDHVVGFFHAKDMLKVPEDQRDGAISRQLIRPMLVVPESRKVQPLLVDMQRERRHVALVVDEHGGTAGIATIEDVVEELVGEIRDEYDATELGIEQLAESRYLVPGSLRVHEAADYLGVDLPEGDYETVAGFLMDRLGRVPKRRDHITHNGWRLSVRTMHRRRVVQVLVERAPDATPG